MATADELLAGMSTGGDTTLVIDNYLRTINIPKTITNLGVEHDDEVLRLNFKMPRYLDDTDLSKFSIRINYINANGDTDAYTVNDNDKIVGDTFIKFSWLVGPTATAYKGDTKFIVCMKILGDNGYIDREYNTTIATLPVLEGLEVNPSVVIRYSDIIEQWRQEIFGEGKSVVQAIESASQKAQENLVLKGAEVLATIPEEYQETAKAAQEGIRTKGDAIVCSAQGEQIIVSDSSNDHLRGLRVFGKSTRAITTGKNLLPNKIKSYGSRNGITFTDLGDDKIKVCGTATSNTTYVYCPFDVGTRTPIPAGTYTVSGNSGKNVYLSFFLYESQETTEILSSNASLCEGKTWTFTIDRDAYYGAYLFIGEGKTVPDTVITAQLEVGSVATDYEPYSGGFASPSPDWSQETVDIVNPSINIFGKNMLKISAVDQTINGVSFTINDDGSVTARGTAAEAVFYGLDYDIKNLIPGEVYSLTGCPAGGSASTYRLYAQNSDGSKFSGDIGNGTSFTATDEQWQVLFVVYKNTSVNFTFYPELCLRSLRDTAFRPYVESPTIITGRTLYGVPVESGGTYIDSNGQHWISDEIDFERGLHIRRTRYIDNAATLDWKSWGVNYKREGYTGFFSYHADLGGESGAVLCSIVPYIGDLWGGTGFGVWTTRSGNQYLAVSIPNTMLADTSSKEAAIESFKNLLANTSAKFIVTTLPVEIPLTAEEIETFKSLQSYHRHTVVYNDVGATMELTYNSDTKTYVENGIQRTVAEVMEAIANGSY